MVKELLINYILISLTLKDTILIILLWWENVLVH